MKPTLVALSAMFVLLTLALSVPAQTALVCQFVLGLQSLHDLASTDMGDWVDYQAAVYNGQASSTPPKR